AGEPQGRAQRDPADVALVPREREGPPKPRGRARDRQGEQQAQEAPQPQEALTTPRALLRALCQRLAMCGLSRWGRTSTKRAAGGALCANACAAATSGA